MKAPARFRPPADWAILDREGVVVHVDPLRQSPLAFALSVASGLDARPRRLDARYLYDAAGSALFEQITAQPEYYLTRAEDRLLAAGAAAIRAAAGPTTLVELGSGTSTKTRRLLDAWSAAGPASYVPVDVDLHSLSESCLVLRRLYPSLTIEGLAATYERALPVLSAASPMTVAFLGSSLGNLGWSEYPEFCQSVAAALSPDDHFLVGLDLVKRPADLEAAYNDAAGVTAAFTRNLFARMNRDLLTDVSLDAIEHVAYYDSNRERIEIFAEARREFVIRIAALDREFRIARGERILTEVSHKFRPEAVVATLERFGFRLIWSVEGADQGAVRQGLRAPAGKARPSESFGLFLFRRIPLSRPAPSPAASVRTPFDLLAETRARTLDMVAPIDDQDLERQHSRLMSPIAWDLGHITQFEEQWLLRTPGQGPSGPDATATATATTPADHLYDPQATPRARRDQLALPPMAAVRQRMLDVRCRVEERLICSPTPRASTATATVAATAASPLLADDLAVHLVVEHEAQHQETILQAIALREDLVYQPAFMRERTAPSGSRQLTESLLIPAGRFVMGTDDRTWAYDNERPAHEVDVAAFRIDRCPVTNRQFLEFMEDGGYSRPELWSERGQHWLAQTGASAPEHWRRAQVGASGWARGWQAIRFGRVVPLDPDCPVVHVSWYEADAYARWAGGRLPSEAEWEKAAAWDPTRGCSRRAPWGDEPWEPSRANLDQRHFEPAPAGAYLEGRSAYGCLQMLGDVWEWTGTWFDGYPGFESFPYREYSEIFFGKTYRVLRGASFATRAIVARATFRNWDLPERRQIFAGFRCARDLAPNAR